ncbi:MAG: hypothetical protein AAGB22_10480, partial [Bacteroidota bacterium]
LIQPRLDDAGIAYHLKDEHTVAIDPMISNAIGGIKLMVAEQDVPEVVALLKDADSAFALQVDDEHEEDWDFLNEEAEITRRNYRVFLVFLVVFILAALFGITFYAIR